MSRDEPIGDQWGSRSFKFSTIISERIDIGMTSLLDRMKEDIKDSKPVTRGVHNVTLNIAKTEG
jgi:hypothetical protein